jgi:xanthine dehydrogenase accessory factor
METLYPIIIEAAGKNRGAVLATLIKQTGSTPREAGTRFVVLDDGTFHGTIGGGLFEARVIEEAQKVMGAGRPSRFRFRLTGTDVADTDMLCGGEGEVFLEPVPPGAGSHLRVFEKALELIREGRGGTLVTCLDPDLWTGDEPPKALFGAGGEVAGSIPGYGDKIPGPAEVPVSGQENRQVEVAVLDAGVHGPMEVLIEPLPATPVLYVFGGGHVAGEIVPLGARVGFRVVVIDDRPEFADPARFPKAGLVMHAPFEGITERLPVNASSYLVIVTRGHLHDKTVLAQALKTGARYIGMIGSSRKIRIIYDHLLAEGFEPADLQRVHAPIGLDIGAETPEEIAVSIVAELILARAGGGKRKGCAHGPVHPPVC